MTLLFVLLLKSMTQCCCLSFNTLLPMLMTIPLVNSSAMHPHSLESAVLDVYNSGDNSLLTPDVGGSGNTRKFTDAVCARL